MKLILRDDFESKYLTGKVDAYVLSRPRLDKRWVRDLVYRMTDSDDAKAVKILNGINKQGIEYINGSELTYKINGPTGNRVLNIDEMATSEKLFLLGCTAKKASKPVVILDSFSTLSKSTAYKFLKLADNFSNLYCCVDSEFTLQDYKDIMAGKLNFEDL